ncbi:hypothetical protein [Tsukamurella tyrosinosolvens]|uniref:hypothetical protein n=1 Tax=Tsukamurella tyrosinosolvens TaxID=57704 RepID=UPI0011C03064|nr:hypothetical protein [Tsukamurella tyrosinosolvens]
MEWDMGSGVVRIDTKSGSPVGFVSRENPEITYLLERDLDSWHSPEHAWGSGFIVTPSGAARWNSPDEVEFAPHSVRCVYGIDEGLTLTVVRRATPGAAAYEEAYEFSNTSDEEISADSLGISTPFRDVYEDAAISLARGVHAHVWTGGEVAWVVAEPMAGTGPALRLDVHQGRLSAYSIDSRNHFTSSNVRGHIILQATDFARNPGAFGGQRPVVIAPGQKWVLSWSVRWHESREAAFAVSSGRCPDTLAAVVGSPLSLGGATDVSPLDTDVTVLPGDDGPAVTSESAGVKHLDVDRQRIALLFHEPVKDVVVQRIRYILANQRAMERGGIDAAAFVPCDTRTGLTRPTSGWPDWSDGAERVGMPTLMQEARKRGWVGTEVDEPLTRWAEFARARLLDESFAPRWGSVTPPAPPRLYNSPWLAHFFAEQYRLFGREGDLETAGRILERSFELGADQHLSIGHAEAVELVYALLRAHGEGERAEAIRGRITDSARHFAAVGTGLPNHEVRYEQSMVAPLVTLYAHALRIEDDDEVRSALTTSLRWLRAFGGKQPHVRMNEIGIRHWDGFWFGTTRQWGDVFPHYWSVLTAVALHHLPAGVRAAGDGEVIRQIFAANLASFDTAGAATAAFIMPSTVDGNPGYAADPLANDQDWALTLLLRTDCVSEKGGVIAPL